MTEPTLDTKIAVLENEVKNNSEFFNKINHSLSEQISELRVDVRTTDNSVNRIETTIANFDRQFSDNINSQFMQMRLDNQVDRQKNHAEMTAIIEKLREQMFDKVESVKTDLEDELQDIREDVDTLKRFKWTALGAASLITAEFLTRLYGLF